MFSIAYIDKPADNTSVHESFHSQSLRVIVIGRSSKSNCVEFYHPPSKKVIATPNYDRMEPTLSAGPIFDLKYDGGLFFNTYHNKADTHRMGTHTLDSIVYFKLHHNSPLHVVTKVIGPPQPGSGIYILQHLKTKNIFNIPAHRIIADNPHATPSYVIKNRDNALPIWIKSNAPATMITTIMEQPKRETLVLLTYNT